MNIKEFKNLNIILKLILIVFCALLMLQIIVNYDNKYTSNSQNIQEGICYITKDNLSILTNDWEFYPDELLTPEDLEEKRSYYKISIGEYANLAPFHDDKNSYGVSTYRMKINGTGTFAMYLQEPFCATNVYVDGKLLGSTGDVENYSPLIKDSIYTFNLQGDSEIVIQTANYSHYYGGIWYPPIIGDIDDVLSVVVSRLIFYVFLSTTAITLAIYCFFIWRRKKGNIVNFHFGIFCISFGVRVMYPMFRFFGVPLIRILYAFEDICAMICLFATIVIATEIFYVSKKVATISKNIAKTMCVVCTVIPLFILPSNPSFTVYYGIAISVYKIVISLILVIIILYRLDYPYAGISFIAVTVNSIFLLHGVLYINHFEPIRFGWQEEYGSFFMVICFAILMIRRNRQIDTENINLTENLKGEVLTMTKSLRSLVVERSQLINEIGHDMKSPLTSFANMIEIINMNDIMLDDATKERIKSIENKSTILKTRLDEIQQITSNDAIADSMENISLNKFMLEFYKINKPVVELDGPDFLCHITIRECNVYANEERLSRVIENLVYNALDFTKSDGKIAIDLEFDEKNAIIKVSDTGVGIKEEHLPNIFNRNYTVRDDDSGQGLGLFIARSIVLEHNGEISVKSEYLKGSVFTVKLPLV